MLKIIEENDSLKIFINNTLILNHTYRNPAVFLGMGNETIKMKKGNFEIHDSLEEKIPLRNYEILDSNQIRFYSNDYFSMKVKIDTEKDFFYFKFEKKDQNRFWIKLYGEEEEGIFGLGEQYSELNMKGKKVPLWVSEQGVGRNKKELLTFFADKIDNAGGDWYTTYYPQPTYVSSRRYSCIVEGSSYMEFDFSKKDNEIFSFEIPEKIIFCTGKTLKTVLKNQSVLLGKQPVLPEWTGGGITLGLQGGTEVVLPKLKAAQNKGLKVNAIWIQDWSGKKITDFGKQVFWNWRYSEEMYPNLPQTIKDLKDEGIRVMGYINPFLIPEGDIYKEGAEKGYFVKNSDGDIYHVIITTFPAAIVDLTNKKAYDWYKNIIKKNMIEIGLSGWMADFGEYLPTDAVLYSGIPAKIYHNIYPVEWAKLNREAIEEEGKLGEIMFFTRAGYLGTTKYSTMVWNGDQMVDWSVDDGLPSVIPASISLGYSGFNLCHSDIGGYTTIKKPFGNYIRSKELFMRWVEMAAFSPFMRTHEGNIPDINWQFDSDSETLEHLSKFVNVFVSLQPYIKDSMKESQKKGLPIIRHTFLNNENEPKFINDKYQYMLGEDILVCPVIKKDSEKMKVNFPIGKWVNFWNEKEYVGGFFEVESPIGNPAVFYKRNSKWENLFKGIKENI